MKIANLKISNFKAIKNLEISSLGDVVVIAGPNGCGKSCVLDAIRFLKSVYAGYRQENEWHNFFNEFQLDINNADEVRRLFFDRSKPITISATFLLSNIERDYVKSNARQIIFKSLSAQTFGVRNTPFLNASAHRAMPADDAEKVEQATEHYTRLIIDGLNKTKQTVL